MSPLRKASLALMISLAVLPSYTARSQEPEPKEIKVDQAILQGAELPPGTPFPLPGIDLSNDVKRQVVVEQGTDKFYNGHPTTVLLPDGKTMYCVWTHGHGGACGYMKRSDDAGLTWSEMLTLPENWSTVKNAPTIYRLKDPQGMERLFVFGGQGADGAMHQATSTDGGKTWSPMTSNGLVCVVPFTSIQPVDGGKKLLGVSNIRRPGETKEKNSNVLAQSISEDGGLTWKPWQVILDLPGRKPCEPALIRSPDGKELLCLMRENEQRRSLYMTSIDEGKTWSAEKSAPIGLAGDRHAAVYAPDGRLVVCFRDRAAQSGMFRHFVAWVGRYEDIKAGEGQYRLKLLHSFKGTDNGYPGVEVLPDGTIVATTYIKYRRGPELHSIVSTRFKLDETDKLPPMKTEEPRVP